MDDRPRIEDYPDTLEGRHLWGKDMARWNELNGIKSKDLIAQWNRERKNTRG